MNVKSLILLTIILFSSASQAGLYVLELRKSGRAGGGIFQTEWPEIADSVIMQTGHHSERDRNNQFQVNWMEEYLVLKKWDRRTELNLDAGEELLSEPDRVVEIRYNLWNPNSGTSYARGSLDELYPPKAWGQELLPRIKNRNKISHGLELTIELRTERRLRQITISDHRVFEMLGLCERLLE